MSAWPVYNDVRNYNLSFLKHAIFIGCYDTVRSILKETFVFDKLLSMHSLNMAKPEIFELLLKSKYEKDVFLNNVIKNFTSGADLRKVVEQFSGDYSVDYCVNLFHEYTFEKLEPNVTHPSLKIFKHLSYFVDDFLRKSIEYGFFDNIEKLRKCDFINICFDPKRNQQHAESLDILLNNIKKAITREELGWRCGPDSGIWPSIEPEDYFKTLQVVRDISV